MAKISKKNQDPNQVHEDKIGIDRLLSKQSEHFKNGTGIRMASKGAGTILSRRILSNGETELSIEWDDGSISTIKPIALN